MRSYFVKRPTDAEPMYFSKIKHLTNLPEGTTIEVHITESDGTLIETEKIPVVDGKPQIKGRGKQKAKSATGRF